MVSKILLVVLISCTVALASPINRDDENAESTEEKLPAFLEFLRNTFGKLLGKFHNAIIESLRKVFDKIQQKLVSKEFKLSIEELEKIVKVIYNENGGLKGDDKDKEIIEKQLEKAAKIFEKMLVEAIEYSKEDTNKTVDASEFKNAVDELKQLVDKLYH